MNRLTREILSRLIRRLCVGAALPALALAAIAGPSADEPHDAIYMQRLRAEKMAAMKRKVYYTGRRFDVESLPSYVPGEPVSGTIKIWGLNYLGDCMLADYWAAGFQKYQPQVKIEYSLPTALTSTTGLVAGTCDIGANRKMTFTELLQYERVFDRDPLEIPLATGSLDVSGWSEVMAIFVNSANPVTRLSMKQLDGIFGSAREGGWVLTVWHPEFARGPEANIRTWGQVGLTGEWAGKRITPYSATIRYDTSTKFSDAVLHSSDKWNEDTRMYGNYANPDGTTLGWWAGIAKGLSSDRYGIGYAGVQAKNPQIKTIAIQAKEGGPYVEPTLESLQSREFPLFQANYFYVNREPGKPLPPKIKEFFKYTLSREGQEEVIRDGKYLPLNAGLVKAALKSLE